MLRNLGICEIRQNLLLLSGTYVFLSCGFSKEIPYFCNQLETFKSRSDYENW